MWSLSVYPQTAPGMRGASSMTRRRKRSAGPAAP
jgi:hypothetical protein